MSKFNIELSSVPDRENLVAEIWYENKMVAEVNKETEKFVRSEERRVGKEC